MFFRASKSKLQQLQNHKILIKAVLLLLLFALIGRTSAQDAHGKVLVQVNKTVEVDFLKIEPFNARVLFYHMIHEQAGQCFVTSVREPSVLSVAACNKELAADELFIAMELLLNRAVNEEEAYDKFMIYEFIQIYDPHDNGWLINFLMGIDEAQGNTCATSDPFCTSNIYSFPAGVNSGTAEPGPNYGCLSTRPNPVWYHMRILQPGNITIKMTGTRTNGQPMDIDFALWGPYSDPISPCVQQLTANCPQCPSSGCCPNNTSNPNFYPSGNLHDCSYSTAAIEHAHVVNGQTGQYYIMLITNFANAAGNITFQKIAGNGETDCTILPPPVSSNSPVCVGQQIQLYADFVTNATYSWTGPSGFTSNQQNPVINNAQLSNAGNYTLIINVNGNLSEPAIAAVEVFPTPVPDFVFTSTCFGDSTFFTDISATLPAGQQITSWLWDFGDGNSSSIQHPVHYYNAPGTYTVTLKTYTDDLMCEQMKVKQVPVDVATQANAGEDTTIFHGWQTTLNGSVFDGSGSYSVQWQPADMVLQPNNLITNTVNLTATVVYTLIVTDQITSCVQSDQVTVFVTGAPFTVSATAYPQTVCEGQPIQLVAIASGGSGNYTFSWTSDPPGFSSQESQPMVTPLVTTTYFVSVFDGQITQNSQITVTVNSVPWTDAGPDQIVPNGWTTQLDGSVFGNSQSYSLLWQPSNMLVDPTVEDPVTLPMQTTTTFVITATDDNSGCSSTDETIVFVSGGALGVMATANPTEICPGQVVQLNANPFGGSGDYTYLWSSNPVGFSSTLRNPLVSPVATTTYTVQVDDGQNQVSATVLVTVKPVPLVNAGADVSIPSGWEAQLNGQVSNGSGSYAYDWQPAEFLSNNQIPNPHTIPLTESKLFTLYVTDQVYLCSGQDNVMVSISGGPLGVDVTASSNNICSGDQVFLQANPYGGSGQYQFSWTSYPPGFTTDIPDPSDFPDQSITYYVSVFDGVNTVYGSLTVQVRPRPIAHAGADQIINIGTSTLLIGSASSGSGQYNYAWQPALMVENPDQAITKTSILSESVVFSLQVTDQNGCVSNSDEVWINAMGDGLAVFAIASPQIICKGQQTTISAMAFGGGESYTFSWVSDPPGIVSGLTEFVIEPESTVTMTVTVTDGFNQVSNSVLITVNTLPVLNLVPAGAQLFGQDTIVVCVRDTIVMLARQPEHPEGTQYFWSNYYTGDRLTASTNGNWIDIQSFWVRATYPETGCQKTGFLTIIFDFNQCNIGVGEESDKQNVSIIFPNPSDGHLHVRFNETASIQSVEIQSLNGRVVYANHQKQQLPPGTMYNINLSHLQSGIYVLHIRTDISSHTHKFVLTTH